jgi:hypothetical protein
MSRYYGHQLALLGVLTGKRKASARALVSKPYPYFLYDKSAFVVMPFFTAFELKSWPKIQDELEVGIPSFIAFELNEPVVSRFLASSLGVNLPFITSFELTEPVIRKDFKEELIPQIPLFLSFDLKTVTIKVTFDSESVGVSIPTFTTFNLE